MKGYLTAGELSHLFGINVQTLHYYDRIGVLVPEKRSESGLRMYRFDQVYSLASIRFMRKMGYSVEEIRDFRNLRQTDLTIRRLREQSKAVRAQLEELMRIDEALVRKADFIESRLSQIDTEAVEVQTFDERYYYPIGAEEQIYISDSFYFFPTLAFYGEELRFFGALLDGKDCQGRKKGRPKEKSGVAVIPAGDYLVGWHVGPYERIRESFDRMRSAYPSLALSEDIVTLNIIDQFVEKDSARYITEIQIPLL